MSDSYQEIYNGEIFQKSQCIQKENSLMDFFGKNLSALGYTPTDIRRKIWTRESKTVVVCLTDSFTDCANNPNTPIPRMFDSNTVVITENFVQLPTQYRVCRLPESFFGIYSYQPSDHNWRPSARINLNVNRIDEIRLSVLAKFYQYTSKNISPPFAQDLVNFNCHSWEGNNVTQQDFKDNFNRCAGRSFGVAQPEYIRACQNLVEHMPFKNYQHSVDQAHLSAWVNMVIETYSGRGTIALSEKTFRALVSPVPSVIYTGQYAMTWLENMGFDIMRDVISHEYDNTLPDHQYQKIDQFVNTAISTAEKLKSQDWQHIESRAQTAAATNCARLAEMQRSWPEDFAQWWVNTVKVIA